MKSGVRIKSSREPYQRAGITFPHGRAWREFDFEDIDRATLMRCLADDVLTIEIWDAETSTWKPAPAELRAEASRRLAAGGHVTMVDIDGDDEIEVEPSEVGGDGSSSPGRAPRRRNPAPSSSPE